MSASDVRAYYDDFSRTYDRGRDRGYHAMVDDIEAGAVIDLAAGRDVLEVGCGTGLVLERVARVARRAEGVDLSPGMLEHARLRGLSVREGDATAIPCPDASFDVVYAFKVLAHIPDVDRAIAEMFRVVRPGGHVLVEVYNRNSLRFVSRALAGARRIGASHAESDVPTRWETLAQAPARCARRACRRRPNPHAPRASACDSARRLALATRGASCLPRAARAVRRVRDPRRAPCRLSLALPAFRRGSRRSR
jgi:ubiquinone/menaquinone biosynthesis C-methylase UbiE